MVVLDIEGKTAQWAHVGDSRLYFFRKNRFEAHTKDHSVPQMLVNIGQIKESEIRHHPDRSSLLHTIGYPWDGNPCEASEQIRIRSGDAFLLCSDGRDSCTEPGCGNMAGKYDRSSKDPCRRCGHGQLFRNLCIY